MSANPRGRIVIINNQYFTDGKHHPREGAKTDATLLCELFRQLHFRDVLESDKSAEVSHKSEQFL